MDDVCNSSSSCFEGSRFVFPQISSNIIQHEALGQFCETSGPPIVKLNTKMNHSHKQSSPVPFRMASGRGVGNGCTS